MSLLPRFLAPVSVAVAFAAAAAPAYADPVATFPGATVEITDAGPQSNTVHLTVTPTDPADLENTHVFLGGDTTTPYTAIGVDGVRDARYAEEADGELSTADCAIYNGSDVEESAPVTVADDGTSYSADLPKGEVIAFESTGVAVGVVGQDAACENQGFDGLDIDYVNSHDRIDGFSWADPVAPVVTDVDGGRRQVALSFDQELGTHYDIYRVGGTAPFAENIRGDGDDVQVVLTEGPDGERLTPGTEYQFQVRATRHFNRDGEDEQPTSPPSAIATATTDVAQVLHFTGTPAATTTDRSARFSWAIDGSDGEAPWCSLDATEMSGTEVPCTTTGAAIDGLAVGPHTLSVFPADGENYYTYSWTVNAVPAAPAAPIAAPVPAAPAVKADPDGDGIRNTWLVGGKPAPAPSTPKARVVGGDVKLKFGATVKNAKKLRVFRAVGKGKYKLAKTLKPKTKTFTDKSVKAGKTYRYKTVAVNAKGQQSKASGKATVKVKR